MMREANPSTILKGQRSNYKAKQMSTKLGKQPQKNNRENKYSKTKIDPAQNQHQNTAAHHFPTTYFSHKAIAVTS